ncbi:MAG: phosphatidylglycerophosphatase A [Candidatus Kerfeldbacteria bacterium]|nr:phosphatidylglycerophosphatase A [Candidatus Kerfeldbacteria bacterium]
MRTRLALFIATGFGSGYLPIGPGSWGSFMMAVAAWWLLGLPWWLYGTIMVGIFIIGLWASQIADPLLPHVKGGTHDSTHIVIDEWVGMLITFIPLFWYDVTLLHLTMGFLIFRIFDTLKFGLARWADRWGSSWGVMVDDVFAGMHAALVFWAALLIMY